MEKFIETYDNIISTKLANEIEHLVFSSGEFPIYYNHNNTYEGSQTSNPGLVHVFQRDDRLGSRFYHIFSPILYTFCEKNNIEIINIHESRLFLDLPSPKEGPDLPPHTDKTYPHWVLLYYINSDIIGDTIFFDNNGKEIKRISPKKGRILFFDGSIKHCGSHSKTNSRGVINFNFIGNKK